MKSIRISCSFADGVDTVRRVLPPRVAEWRDGGRSLTTPAGSVFVRSAPGDGPTILLLHGYPSSSFDYRQVVPHLAGRAWLTLDFLGFGLSDKPRPHRYSLLGQADIVQTVVASDDNRASRARRARHGHVGHHRAVGPRPSGPLAIRTAAGGAEQRQRDPAPRQPAAGPEIAARPARSARRTAVQQGEVQPGVRAAFRPEPPAIAGGSRRAVGADRQQRRAPHRAPADLLPRRARALRRALARRGAGLAETAELPVGARRPGGDHERARRATRIAARRRRCRACQGSGTTRRSRCPRSSPAPR